MSKKLAGKIKDAVDDDYKGKYPLETIVNVRTQLKRVELPPNVMVFQRFAYLAATKLLPSSSQILMLFLSRCAYENHIGMDIKTISEELLISERSVIRALNELVDSNIIIKIKMIGDARRHDYFINPVAAWKGNSYERKKTITKLTTNNPNQLQMFGETDQEKKAITVNKDFDTPLLALDKKSFPVSGAEIK